MYKCCFKQCLKKTIRKYKNCVYMYKCCFKQHK